MQELFEKYSERPKEIPTAQLQLAAVRTQQSESPVVTRGLKRTRWVEKEILHTFGLMELQ